MTVTEEQLSKLPGDVLDNLRRADRLWSAYKHRDIAVPSVIEIRAGDLDAVEWDLVICGGTLGILLGAALAQRGWRIALVERGVLRGRDQEWNISRKELAVCLQLGLLTEEELDGAIATEYNPARVAFHKGIELWVEDVLNIGVDPVRLLELLKEKFLSYGGRLYEHTAFQGAGVYANGVQVEIETAIGNNATDETTQHHLTTRMLIDSMGHFSPIARQARQGKAPDAVCLVVGTCAEGYPENETGDLFASITPIQNQCQYFWEAFPARDGRTTYLFTYLDAHPDRPSLEEFFEDYWQLLPEYQRCSLDQLSVKRALFGFFPCYRDSPLQLPWNRMLAVGDSSGSQSPLSFGGFGAMIRHLSRLTVGIHEALAVDALDAESLRLLQPYQPSLSVTWLFQKSMSVGVHQTPSPNQINNLLSGVFEGMDQLGDSVLKPFLQDVVQFWPLTQALVQTTLQNPLLGLGVIPDVGLEELLRWSKHYVSLGIYSGFTQLERLLPEGLLKPAIESLSPLERYRWSRRIDAWCYGSGCDYHSEQVHPERVHPEQVHTGQVHSKQNRDE